MGQFGSGTPSEVSSSCCGDVWCVVQLFAHNAANLFIDGDIGLREHHIQNRLEFCLRVKTIFCRSPLQRVFRNGVAMTRDCSVISGEVIQNLPVMTVILNFLHLIPGCHISSLR